MLVVTRTAYPNLQYLVIAGNDSIVPFHRVPDETSMSNEAAYWPGTQENSPVGAALGESYFLSDDYYASFEAGVAWRGRYLHLPYLAIGRLVETPAEMMALIDAFLTAPTRTLSSGLVVGYELLLDQAYAVRQEMLAGGLSVDELINDYWQKNDLEDAWLASRHDLGSINAHFSHWEAVPAETAGGFVTAEDVQTGSADRAGALDFSVGCHSGLNIPDDQALTHGTDFCQAQAGRGVNWIANTGFGYGDWDEIAYSEQLSLLFIRHLRQGASVGDALRWAKAEYFNRTGVHSFTPFDEKVLSEMTLYGLPMLHLEFPTSLKLKGLQWILQDDAAEAQLASRIPVLDAAGLTALRVTFELPVASQIITHGTYFHINEERAAVAGMPYVPRTSVTVTLAGEYARGAFFEGGQYQTYSPFDPVITRLVTDTVAGLSEPVYDFAEWVPSVWDLVNSVKTQEGLQQRLVILPGQYRALSPIMGTMRVFDTMTYTVYYSDTEDVWPPSFWLVEGTRLGNSQFITVEVTDFSGVARAAVGYTWGNGW